jgi:hypothetical protein
VDNLKIEFSILSVLRTNNSGYCKSTKSPVQARHSAGSPSTGEAEVGRLLELRNSKTTWDSISKKLPKGKRKKKKTVQWDTVVLEARGLTFS